MSSLATILLLTVTLTTTLVLSKPVFQHGAKEEKTEERDIVFDPTADTDFTIKVGDMTLFTDSYLEMFEENDKASSNKREKRTVVNRESQMWPECTIPFELDNEYYSYNQRRLVLQAMAHWEEHTCVRFKNRTNERDFIFIYPGVGCFSFVGKTSRQQKVSIGPGCYSFSAAVHELGHAIGFYHEHNRPDRDEHIDIIDENIVNGFGIDQQFKKLSEDSVDLLGVGYDYNSIMHYDSNFFSKSYHLDTIQAKDPSIPIGSATELSLLDIMRANLLCGCSNSPEEHPPRLIVVPEPEQEAKSNDVPPHEFECGEIFDGVESGSFSSPTYGVYTHNTDCEWSIRVPEGYQLKMTIEIDMDYTSGCTQDYLEVHERLDRSGYRLGRWCYRNYDFVSYTLTNTAHIRYHTDGANKRSGLKGFRISFETQDIDECLFHGHCSHGCTNLPGSYQCSCPEGFYLSADNHQCFDVNECALNKGGCDHKCVNKGGSFHCECNKGFQLLSDGKTCIEGNNVVDPCVDNTCEHECVVIKGSPLTAKCLCPKGYALSSNGRTCEDINECNTNNGGCAFVCVNSEGSHECEEPIVIPDTPQSLVKLPDVTAHIPTIEVKTEAPTTTEAKTQPPPTTEAKTPPTTEAKTQPPPTTEAKTEPPTTTEAKTQPPPTTEAKTPPTTEAKTQPPPTTEAKTEPPPTTEAKTEPPTTTEAKTEPPTTAAPTEPPLPRSGFVQSPNWPETYPVNIDLRWTIECPTPTSRISISLNNSPFWLGGQQSQGCPKDWVKVHQGETERGSQFGPFCFKVPPPDFMVQSNKALVLFHAGSKHHHTRTGFKLTYQCL